MQNKNGILNLITSVRKHSQLYTNFIQNDEDDTKEWSEVAQECGMSISEAQDQWNILMNEYMEYLKNNQDFSLAQYMDFLQPHLFAINDKEDIDEVELLNAIGSKNVKETTLDDEDHANDEEVKSGICFEAPKQDNAVEEQKAKTQNSTSLSKNSAIPQENSITNLSSLELIFLGYAKQLQKMPIALQLATKRKIANIMDEAELQMMS